MNRKYIILLIISCVSATSFTCSDYTQLGCNGCVVNFNSITSGCVWCGSVDNNGTSSNGGCYDYSTISSDCQNGYMEDTNMQTYGCCSSTLRIGSNTELVCSADFSNSVQSMTTNLLVVIGIYCWVVGFIAVFFSYNSYKKDCGGAFLHGIIYPFFLIKLFFYDIE